MLIAAACTIGVQMVAYAKRGVRYLHACTPGKVHIVIVRTTVDRDLIDRGALMVSNSHASLGGQTTMMGRGRPSNKHMYKYHHTELFKRQRAEGGYHGGATVWNVTAAATVVIVVDFGRC